LVAQNDRNRCKSEIANAIRALATVAHTTKDYDYIIFADTEDDTGVVFGSRIDHKDGPNAKESSLGNHVRSHESYSPWLATSYEQ
jgi:hypothetical protein